MKSLFLSIFFLMALLNTTNQIIFRHSGAPEQKLSHNIERRLKTVMSSEIAPKRKARKLLSPELVEAEIQDRMSQRQSQLSVQQLERQAQIRQFEESLAEVGKFVDEITDAVRTKTSEVQSAISSISKSRNSEHNFYKLTPQKTK